MPSARGACCLKVEGNAVVAGNCDADAERDQFFGLGVKRFGGERAIVIGSKCSATNGHRLSHAAPWSASGAIWRPSKLTIVEQSAPR